LLFAVLKCNDMLSAETINEDLKAIRLKSPLVHNITNYVVMNNTANALLAAGASPVMAHALEEVKDMMTIASSLVINMGTLSTLWVEAMISAGREAIRLDKPVVFDPVGAGATPYRTSVANSLIKECRPSIIRGNASEILALAGHTETTKGVDSTASSTGAVQAAWKLAHEADCIVSLSGETDYITDGKSIIAIKNGSPLMPKVTGMGCTASALTGAFVAVNRNYLCAAAHAMAVMGIAGEIAASRSAGPGSLQLNFIDVLYNISFIDLEQRLSFSL